MKEFGGCSFGAYTVLYERYSNRILNFIGRSFKMDFDQSEEITQEVFIKVFENKYKYKSHFQFSTWLYTIARNKAIDILRKTKKEKDLESAKQEFLKLFIKAYRIAEDFGWSYVAMFNICRSFYNQNRDFILKLVKASQKPVLLNLGIPEGKYYWVINIDLDFIDNLKRPVESVGMQIDLGNAKRFGIKFIDENGKRRYPVIIHAALMGSLERWINNLLENAVKQLN